MPLILMDVTNLGQIWAKFEMVEELNIKRVNLSVVEYNKAFNIPRYELIRNLKHASIILMRGVTNTSNASIVRSS